MESITSTQVAIQVGFKHCIYQHEIYSNNHYTMEFITSTQEPYKWDSNIVYTSMKCITITITQWNPLQVLKYPYKWVSNIVFTNMKSIEITITQQNQLLVLKYPYKWYSNIVSTTMKPIAITIQQWNPLTVLKYPYKWD